jgi:hypothetical protein
MLRKKPWEPRFWDVRGPDVWFILILILLSSPPMESEYRRALLKSCSYLDSTRFDVICEPDELFRAEKGQKVAFWGLTCCHAFHQICCRLCCRFWMLGICVRNALTSCRKVSEPEFASRKSLTSWNLTWKRVVCSPWGIHVCSSYFFKVSGSSQVVFFLLKSILKVVLAKFQVVC